jgi:hypothetical protein
MKLTKNERAILTTFVSVAQKILHSSKHSSKANGRNGTKLRKRRSTEDVALLRKQIRAARRHVPVKRIADELGVTTAYIYQLTR